MASVRLSEEMNARLTNLALVTKRSKSSFMNEALEMYMEDIEDMSIAMHRLSSPNKKFFTTSELKKG